MVAIGNGAVTADVVIVAEAILTGATMGEAVAAIDPEWAKSL